jgi:hypothetical protein
MSTENTKGYIDNPLNGWTCRNGFQAITMTGNLDVSAVPGRYAQVLKLDPGGSARDLTLWDADETAGLMLRLINGADAAETITVKESTADGGSTIETIEQNTEIELFSDGSAWSFVLKRTIALT